MPIAIFGDVHGHLRLLFELCRRWQEAHGRRLDAVLQCGDMGWFPNPARIDRATRKYAKEDPDELGVSQYFAWSASKTDPRLDETLRGDPGFLATVSASVYWCHGNHEDFNAIREAAGDRDVAVLDRYERICWCRSGKSLVLAGSRIGFLGGGPESEASGDSWQVVQSADADALARFELDVLISHPAPRQIGGESDRTGSAHIRRLVERAQPRWHVFGHHRDPIPPASINKTQCRWLNDAGFERDGRLRRGCMAIFDGDSVEVVDDKWIRAVTRWSWNT